MDLSMNFCPWTSMVSAVKARGRRGFDKRRFVHGRGRRGFSNAVVVHVHGLRVFAVDPEPCQLNRYGFNRAALISKTIKSLIKPNNEMVNSAPSVLTYFRLKPF